jgi:ABC-type transport system involved in cytochrome c biogenesis permease subunit
MKIFAVLVIAIVILIGQLSSFGHAAIELHKDQFLNAVANIEPQVAADWPIQNNGRWKPFQSLAREQLLFISGKPNFWELSPTKFYLGLMVYPAAKELAMIEVRLPELRKTLGLPTDRRYFSVNELRQSSLMTLAQPLSEKQQANRRSLNELENKTLEAAQQVFVAEEIIQGSALTQLLPDEGMPQDSNHSAVSMGYTPTISIANFIDVVKSGLQEAQRLESLKIREQLYQATGAANKDTLPSLIKREILYNQIQPFLWAAWLSLIIAILLLWQSRKPFISYPLLLGIMGLPMIIEMAGFGIRISITGFAPVTNMYGTMLWVSFGVGLFSLLLFALYRHLHLAALLNFGVFILLLLTHSIPLVLSPDMDPIVAVLRSNFWLTIHVLTITISYAAFSIAMLIGNVAIIRQIIGVASNEFVKTYSHFTYRIIQLGVLLLTAGIILGGIWADYSWGRFWGWDPKETWALIADLGFIVLLHARQVQWLSPMGLMIFSPIAYLLVVMAWYGVNFILAAGLHSYGFSSGGATMVAIFVASQLILFFLAAVRAKFSKAKKTLHENK